MVGDPGAGQWLLHCSAWEVMRTREFLERVQPGELLPRRWFKEVPQLFPGSCHI